jgi:hypothetical protein
VCLKDLKGRGSDLNELSYRYLLEETEEYHEHLWSGKSLLGIRFEGKTSSLRFALNTAEASEETARLSGRDVLRLC